MARQPHTGSSRKASGSIKPHAQQKRTKSKKPHWKHQKVTLKLLKKEPRVLDLSDPGTGKTRSALEAFYDRTGKAALILCPKSLMESAWLQDASEYTPDLRCSVAYAENREEAFERDADIYITNIDASKWFLKKFPRDRDRAKFFSKFDTLIIDELTGYKERTSQRSKAAAKIKDYFKYREGMTGTPNSNTITEIWHQALLIDDGVRLGTSFFHFRSHMCIPEQVGPKANMLKWTDKPGAEEAVAALLSDISVRHDFDECMDIPPNHTYAVGFRMNRKLRQMYEEMAASAILTLSNEEISAVNAAVVRNKLLQIASGAVYAGDGSYRLLDTERYHLIIDLVKQRKHSVVFFNWKHQKEELAKIAKAEGVNYAIIDGDVPVSRRNEIVKAYQAGFYQTVFLHPATGAHGLTLTKGTATVWSSPIYQADFLKQGLHRIYRGGQTLPTETILVEAENSVEQLVYEILNGKRQRMINFLDMLRT